MSEIEKEKVIQIGILVRNVENAAEAWSRFLNMEPIFIETAEYEVTGASYLGKPCYGMLKQAVFELENIQIELISPMNDEPSVWRDCLERDGEGLHHIAFFTSNMALSVNNMADAGYKVMQSGAWPDQPKGGRYAYLDTREDLKTIIEFLEY